MAKLDKTLHLFYHSFYILFCIRKKKQETQINMLSCWLLFRIKNDSSFKSQFFSPVIVVANLIDLKKYLMMYQLESTSLFYGLAFLT